MSFNKVNSDGSLTRVAGGTLYADAPVGAIIPYGGTTAPDGFLFCQGQAVSRTTYAELFKVIGTAFGAGDGSTTFNVPDLREATTKGVGLSGKSNNHFDSDGVALGEFVEDRMQDHRHTSILSSPDNPGSTTAWTPAITPNLTVVQLADSFIAEGRTGATTEVKAVGVNYIIKATQVGAPADFAPVDTIESGNMNAITSNAVAGAMAVTTGTGTRNATYVKSDSFTATWTKIGHLVTAEVQFNLSQATLSTEELITGFPKPVCPVAVVAQGEANDAAYGLVLRTNGSIRTHYQGIADQFYHATITYITAE